MSTLIENGIHYFPGTFELPGFGALNVNFFAVVGSKKTMIIDTGAPTQVERTIAAISETLDPRSIDYVFLTHLDVDHYGGLQELWKLAPNARLVGNIATMNKGTTFMGIPPERFAVVWPSDEIDLGDRKLTVDHALIEDAFTFWLFDDKTHTCFSSDAFGAVQFAKPVAFADEAPPDAFARGFSLFHQMNFSLLPALEPTRFKAGVEQLAKRDIKQIATVHGPVIRRDIGVSLDLMAAAPSFGPPVPPPLPPIFALDRP